jgi:hypothetical protein
MQQDKKIEELQDTVSEMRTMISQHETERSEMRTMISSLHASLLPRGQGGAQARLKFRCEKNFTFSTTEHYVSAVSFPTWAQVY